MTTVGNPALAAKYGNHGYYSDQLGGPNSQQAKSGFGAQGAGNQMPQQGQYGQHQGQFRQQQQQQPQVMNPNLALQQNAQAQAAAKAQAAADQAAAAAAAAEANKPKTLADVPADQQYLIQSLQQLHEQLKQVGLSGMQVRSFVCF